MATIIETLTASGGPESPGFLNDLVKQLWPNICVAGGQMVKDIVEPMFKTMLPAPLNGLQFAKIDLGTIPIHISRVDVHNTENEGIKLDLDVDWDGCCDIELNGNMIPKFGIEHVKLRGRLSLLLCPLTTVLPLIGAAQVAFINPPFLEFKYTDAAHVANLGVIDRTIRKIIQSIMASMAVLPNRFLLKLDANNDYFKTYQHPIGVLRLTVESGSELGEKKEGKSLLKKLVHDEPDCFVKVSLSAEKIWKTRTINNQRNPEWNETCDFVVSDFEQAIELDVDDDDTGLPDDDIGVAATTVKRLLLEGGRQELALEHKGQPIDGKIKVRGDFFKFVPNPASFSAGGNPDEVVGMMTVLVASAFGVTGKRQELKPNVMVSWGDLASFRTAIKIDAPGTDIENPSFDQAFRVTVKSGTIPGGPPVRIALLDGEKERGSVEVPLDEVLASPGLALEKFFDVGNGATVRAGIWLRGTEHAQLQGN
ncbi:hypothetical protein QBC47DRAFT_392986 [Echria macrotheca]|uniref:C2 domain-containing protein n=1 Tax=Echria macrotheca TaxID=438768 RepID=A0AAJ0F531_9PEZI|nr:hypothetical protein QBC47DRAFT_392986 [Echria macrotheca]